MCQQQNYDKKGYLEQKCYNEQKLDQRMLKTAIRLIAYTAYKVY